MALTTYKDGFTLNMEDGNVTISGVLNNPDQATYALDQDYELPIATQYASEIQTITGISIDLLEAPGSDTSNYTIDLVPTPGTSFTVVGATNTVTISATDATNIASYAYRLYSAADVLVAQTASASNMFAGQVAWPVVSAGQYARFNAVMNNGLEFFGRFDITSGITSPWSGTTQGERVEENGLYSWNAARDAIDLSTSGGWAESDGVWSTKVTVTYLDFNNATQTYSYIKSIIRDEDTGMGCKVYEMLNDYGCQDLAILGMYEGMQLAIECDKGEEAQVLWDALIAMCESLESNCGC